MIVGPACRSSAGRCCHRESRVPSSYGGGCCHQHHPDRVMCRLVAPSTMASWADERRSEARVAGGVGPIDQVVLEWRASSRRQRDATGQPAGSSSTQPRRLHARPAGQWVRRGSPPRALCPGGRTGSRALRHRHRQWARQRPSRGSRGRALQPLTTRRWCSWLWERARRVWISMILTKEIHDQLVGPASDPAQGEPRRGFLCQGSTSTTSPIGAGAT